MTGGWERALLRVVDADIGGGPVRDQWENRFRSALEREGPPGFWRTLRELFLTEGGYPFHMAIADAQLHDREAALADVEHAVSAHNFHAFCLGAEPTLAALHSEPGFQAACRTVGVPFNR